MYDYQVMRKAKETEIHPYNFAYDADHPTRILICFFKYFIHLELLFLIHQQ